MINAQISHSIEAMEIVLEIDFSTIRMETRETMDFFLVLHRTEGDNSQKKIHTANHEVIDLTILVSADLMVDLRLFLPLTNKNSHKI